MTFIVTYDYSEDHFCCFCDVLLLLPSDEAPVLSGLRNLSVIRVSGRLLGLVATAHAPCILTSIPTSRSSKGSNKDAQRRGRPEPRHRVKHNSSCPEFCGPDASRRTFDRTAPPAAPVGGHGAEEVPLGHRASPPELRRRVGDGVDHGQRWVPAESRRSPGRAGVRISRSSEAVDR